jgi:hypothetical protein
MHVHVEFCPLHALITEHEISMAATSRGGIQRKLLSVQEVCHIITTVDTT